ncbi:hypothetical protein ACTMU2_11755, partial [Cupriavidus basilensis]
MAAYFDGDGAEEVEIRRVANAASMKRADWNWAACDHGLTLTHGWRPENGFIPYRWRGYDEGFSAPLHPRPRPTDPPAAPAGSLCAGLHRKLRLAGPLRARIALFG